MKSSSENPLSDKVSTRVRYVETDRAGVVYHSNYLVYFEIGRTSLMRKLGVPYSEIERELGIVLAVVDCRARFRRPARYDDEIQIESTIVGMTGTRVMFDYRVTLPSDESLLCEGSTTLAAVRDGRPVRLPEMLRQLWEDKDGS